MLFPRNVDHQPARGLPLPLKRQFFVLSLLMAAVLLLGYRLFVVVRQADSPPGDGDGDPSARVLWIGKPIPVEEDGAGLEPIEPTPPEPYEEKPEMLLRAAARDRTAAFDDEAITHLLQKVLSLEGSFRREEPVLSLERGEDVFGELIRYPDRYRGRLVEVRGILVSVEPGKRPLQLRGLDFPNPSGRDRAFQSHLYGVDDRYYVVVTLNRRDDLTHRDGVRLRAYFCQLYTNEVEFQGEIRQGTIPLLVGEDYDLIRLPARSGPDLTVYLPALILLPMVAFLVLCLLRERSDRSFQKRREEGRKLQLERRGKDPGPGRGDPASGPIAPDSAAGAQG